MSTKHIGAFSLTEIYFCLTWAARTDRVAQRLTAPKRPSEKELHQTPSAPSSHARFASGLMG